MKLGLINSAWVQAGRGTSFGIAKTRELGFDAIDIFADPLDIEIRERRLLREECARAGLPIISLACVALGLIDFNPSVQRFHVERVSRYLDMAHSAGQYILNELYWKDADGTASFSYPLQGMRSKVHNANFLGAALLCRLSRHTGYKQALEPAMKVIRYSAARQQENGAWDYGEATTQDWADNFHTGYNLCALRAISRDAGTSEFDPQIRKGFEFRDVGFRYPGSDVWAARHLSFRLGVGEVGSIPLLQELLLGADTVVSL